MANGVGLGWRFHEYFWAFLINGKKGFGWVLFSPSFDWWLVELWIRVGLGVDFGPSLVFFCFFFFL